jgi:PhnB protein
LNQEDFMSDHPRPQIKGGAICYMGIDGALKAVDFYKKAFAAEEAMVMPPDEKGRTMHAHLYINNGSVMLSDYFPEHGNCAEPISGFNIMLRIDDVDSWYERAVEAGCESKMKPENMFWGDRYAQVKDPFGVIWAFNGPLK